MQDLHLVVEYTMTFGSFLGAVLVIIQVFTKYNPLKGIRSWFNEPTLTELSKNCSQTLDNKKQILKLIVTSEYMPLPERLKAGKVYVEELKGNGEVSARYSHLRKLYEKELEMKENGSNN